MNNKLLLPLLAIVVVVAAYLLLFAKPNVPEGTLVLYKEGPILSEQCSERVLGDKILVLHSQYCQACKTVIPLLEEIDNELGASMIFLDISVDSDRKAMEKFRIEPAYTPTLVVGCDVYIGAYAKEKYETMIREFLKK